MLLELIFSGGRLVWLLVGCSVVCCALTPGPVARVMRTALMRNDYPREYLRDIVQEAGQLEVPRVERNLRVLLTIAYVAPLVGLLGTLLGLLDTFSQVNTGAGAATSASMADGVYRSLVTSATGLIVAIPAFVLYSFLVSRAKNLLHDIERGGIEIINLIEDSRQQSEIISINERERLTSADEKRSQGGKKSRRRPS